MHPDDAFLLPQAIATYRATLPAYLSPLERAESQLLLSMAHTLQIVQQAYHLPLPAAPDVVQAIADLRTELADLRQSLQPTATTRRHTSRAERPVAFAPMRPVEELIDQAAALDDTASVEELQRYIARPRVQPADIVLTPDDLARNQPKRRERHPIAITPAMMLLVVLISIIIVLGIRLLGT